MKLFKMNNVAGVLFLLFSSCLALQTTADVDEDNCDHLKKTCLLQLGTNTNFPQFPFGATEEELRVTCNNIESGFQCIDNYDKNCRNGSDLTDYKKYVAHLRNVLNGLCNPGPYLTEFKKHQSCLKTTLSAGVTACDAQYTQTMANLKNATKTDEAGLKQDYIKTKCCAYKTFMACLRKETITCGIEASTFLTAYVDRTVGPVMMYLCTGYVLEDCSGNH